MKYEEIKLLKQSEKSTVYLVRAAEGGKQVYVRKRLNGQHPIYPRQNRSDTAVRHQSAIGWMA